MSRSSVMTAGNTDRCQRGESAPLPVHPALTVRPAPVATGHYNGGVELPPSLRLRFCGLEFASPLVLLSGCVGFGEEYTRVAGFSNRDVGAVVLKGTTQQAPLRA